MYLLLSDNIADHKSIAHGALWSMYFLLNPQSDALLMEYVSAHLDHTQLPFVTRRLLVEIIVIETNSACCLLKGVILVLKDIHVLVANLGALLIKLLQKLISDPLSVYL